MKKIIFISTVLIFCLFTFCKNDMEDAVIDFDNGATVTTSVTGFVFDDDNIPVGGAEVRIGTNTAQTDDNGIFILNNITTKSKDTYITIDRDGYLHNSTRIYPSDQSVFNLKFKLLTHDVTETMPAGAGKEIALPNGAKVVLPANPGRFLDGRPYDGDINIGITHLSPDDDDLALKMPGDLTGIDASGNLIMLASFGMLSVELTTTNGEPLQLSDGSAAELSFPVPDDMTGNAPSTIPLWSFEEATGRWMEEGSATLQGSSYVGMVSHFSFWNVDVPYDFVFVQGRIVDEAGLLVHNANVGVTVNSSGITRGGFTNQDGNFAGFMPKDEQLDFEVLLPASACGSITELLSQSYGPFSMDTDIGDISVTTNQVDALVVSGSLINCNGNFVENGFVKFDFDGN